MLYAAYGSNLHPARLSLRLPESQFMGTAGVAGRCLRFHKRSIDMSGKCNIVAGDGLVHVAVYDLSRNEKAQLDEIEGLGLGYTTAAIEVPGFGACYTYIAESSYVDESLRPYSWYKALVLAGCEALSLPSDYTAAVRDVIAIEDPDHERHAENSRIVNLIRNPTNAVTINEG